MGLGMNEDDWRAYMNEVHEFVTKDAYERDKLATDRHKELLRAVEDNGKATVKAIEAGFRLLADALRGR